MGHGLAWRGHAGFTREGLDGGDCDHAYDQESVQKRGPTPLIGVDRLQLPHEAVSEQVDVGLDGDGGWGAPHVEAEPSLFPSDEVRDVEDVVLQELAQFAQLQELGSQVSA